MCYGMRLIVSLTRQIHIPGDRYIDHTIPPHLPKVPSFILAGLIKFLRPAIILTTLPTAHTISPCKQLWKMFRTPQTPAWMIPGGMGRVHQIMVSLNIVRTLALLPSA